MKKLLSIYHCTFIIGAALMLAACEFETSSNGDLDGLWQLTQQDSVGTQTSQDMRQSGIFWAVQVRLLQIKSGPQKGYYRFNRSNGRLRLYSADLDKEGNADTTSLYNYRVLKLNSSKMVLEDDNVKLSFRKY